MEKEIYMYVQIDKNIHEQMQCQGICSLDMGSHLYGFDNEFSDVDKIILYQEKNVPLFDKENGWQYKNDNHDYNYQSFRNFIINTINAETPTNFEALFGTCKILNEFRYGYYLHNIFNLLAGNISYALIKSYIGYAKKDIKYLLHNIQYVNYLKNDSKNISTIHKLKNKLSHLYRGIETIKILLNNEPYIFVPEYNSDERYIKAKKLKNIDDFSSYSISCIINDNRTISLETFINESNEILNKLQQKLDDKLNNNEIVRKCSKETFFSITDFYNKIYQYGFISINDSLYNIIENGLTYQYKGKKYDS